MTDSVVPGSWSIVTTARAPKPIIDRFLAHHLALGADRIFLYFDDPEMAWDIDDPRVTTTVCDAVYWDHKPPPERVVGRQVVNSNAAKARATSEWILHIDVDELLTSNGKVSRLLAKVPNDVDSIRVPNLEAVYAQEPTVHTIFDTKFFKRQVPVKRGLIRNLGVRLVLGRLAKVTRKGFFGHTEGKSFVRVSSVVFVGIHSGKHGTPDRKLNFRPAKLQLLHFDSMSYEEFKIKHMRRINGSSPVQHLPEYRQAQMRLIADVARSEGEAGLRRLYLRMNVFEPARMFLATLFGFVVAIRREG